MARKPNIVIEVSINHAKNVVAVTHTLDGNPVASCDFTIEQALNHIKHIQSGVDMLMGRKPGSGLILPEKH